jgi:hypothetical protein
MAKSRGTEGETPTPRVGKWDKSPSAFSTTGVEMGNDGVQSGGAYSSVADT